MYIKSCLNKDETKQYPPLPFGNEMQEREHDVHSLRLPIIEEQLVKSLKMKPTGMESKVKI